VTPARLRTLLLLAKKPAPTAVDDADAGRIPRIEYVELARRIGAEIVDFHDVERSTHPAVKLAAKKGPHWGLAALGVSRRHEFDHFYATGEDVGMPLGMMLHGVRWYGRTTMVVHHGGTAKRRKVLRALGDRPWRNVIVLASRQREILVDDLGYPAIKVHRMDQWLDARFYAPSGNGHQGGDYVFAVGRESRDYPTLEMAAALLPQVRFRVIASGWAPHAGFDKATNLAGGASNMTVETGLSYEQLRGGYGQARLFVAPLDGVDYAAGVTGICEAMSMGRAIVASDSPGIRDYVKHGVSGLVVPVGDAKAMAAAIGELWNDPERCARMGAHNRSWVEEDMSVDRYAERVAGLLGVRRSEGDAQLC
jgi:glycosyltransferase involved in cell wall biosynthesis